MSELANIKKIVNKRESNEDIAKVKRCVSCRQGGGATRGYQNGATVAYGDEESGVK